MDVDLIGAVKDIYTLIALLIISGVYIITLFYKLKQGKKQIKELTENFTTINKELSTRVEMQNEKILSKLDELQEVNNIDLQASMDFIQIINIKSMLKIMEGIRMITIENDIEDDKRKPVIYEKVRNIVETQFRENLIILSRIYYKDIKLSYFINDNDKIEIINTISQKINLMKDEREFGDVIDYIRNKYHTFIQSAHLDLGTD